MEPDISHQHRNIYLYPVNNPRSKPISINSLTMESQRVIKPGTKRRRPPLACIQCYQRKLKCGRESPCCSRCAKSGNAERCTYRDSTARNSLANGDSTQSHQPQTNLGPTVEPFPTPVSLVNEMERSAKSSKPNVKATHLKGEETATIFYGCSYPLNFYQQVRLTIPSYKRVHLLRCDT